MKLLINVRRNIRKWRVTLKEVGGTQFYGEQLECSLPFTTTDAGNKFIVVEHPYITLDKVGEHIEGDVTWYDKLIISRVPDDLIHGDWMPHEDKHLKKD